MICLTPIRSLVCTVLGLFLALSGPGLQAEPAPPPLELVQSTAPLRHAQSGGWQVTESLNFRVHHVGSQSDADHLARYLEQSRIAIRQRWLAPASQTAWTLKCDVYLYPSGSEFQRLTRYPADAWGFADLEIGAGQVWKRRLDLRSDDSDRLHAVAVHELTHIVLADRFANRQIPRWADEGIALNCEPPARQARMKQWLAEQVRVGRCFTIEQLLMMKNYPRDKFQGDLFYAQSGALVEYLLQQGLDEPEILRLIESTQQHGAGAFTRGSSLRQLESAWKKWLATSLTSATGPQVALDRP